MNDKVFIDTNVLVYAFGNDLARRAEARRILAAGGTISVQVLNEFVDVVRRKLRKQWPEIREALATLSDLLDPPFPLTGEMHGLAVDIAERYGLRIYDGTIVSTAKHAGCRILYTEDLQHGQSIEGVAICNPFLGR